MSGSINREAKSAALDAALCKQALNRPVARNIKLTGTDGVELSLDIAPSLPCLAGHFESFPVVPGVVQIDWVVHYANVLLHIDWPVLRLDRLKFTCPIQPNSSLEVKLLFNREKQWLDFQFFCVKNNYSKGRVVYESPCD